MTALADVFLLPSSELPMKKLSLPDGLSRLGIWIVPLVSVVSLPLFLSGWQQSDRVSPSPAAPASGPLSLPAPRPINAEPRALLAPPQSLLPTANPRPTAAGVATGVSAPSSSASPPAAIASLSKKQAPHRLAHSASASTASPAKKASAPIAHPTLAKPYSPPPLEIRVAILRDEPSTTIATSQAATLRDRNGTLLTSIQGNESLSVQPDGSGLNIGGKTYAGVVWLQPTADSLIYVGDRWYRGKILLLSTGNSLMAVNYVDLEHYLYSVVGSEMHATAPSEALKAQAIAARSYALVHMIRPASDWFDLGNTQRWQVYKGIVSEFNTTQQAVAATAGQILSYSGGVVESLYAATDEIVSRAHGGRGMSQTGAYDLAQQGYDYQRILARYYPGVGLARLIIK